ncbi:16S rRNA (uracil(1498)-N(3))-methyltransferase [Stieleria sp. TO1_6]|uniref:RsmE family RNA methyltransferase n=1 Tax=Stieleria tagensis TaxID=2956795 RepID=UPI00209ADDD7|nr:RsmE family RNA methyltransferase [Stieleria tagensis]MCO8121973.1 16S rRNA (uracil(1498)-N(3))-methyltransferase [Stieleria tagensis]
MTRRYYVPELPAAGGPVDLSDEEARHAARVMRAESGDEITLFDGRGNESLAVIQAIDKRHCCVSAAAPQLVDREPSREIHLGIALPKPERAKELIERLSELGVKRVTPLVCQRTQRRPTNSLLEKLRRIVIESCKQSERNVLMEISTPVPLEKLCERPFSGVRWLAHPGGGSPVEAASTLGETETVTALIGPEGGFAEEETDLAIGSGYQAIGLGKRIYRIETAATAIATILSL